MIEGSSLGGMADLVEFLRERKNSFELIAFWEDFSWRISASYFARSFFKIYKVSAKWEPLLTVFSSARMRIFFST